MDWRLIATTFWSVFVAELGDKTQLATLGLATTGSRWSVFAGAASALILSSGIAVLAGELVSAHVSPLLLKRLAGGSFIALGIWTLLTAKSA